VIFSGPRTSGTGGSFGFVAGNAAGTSGGTGAGAGGRAAGPAAGAHATTASAAEHANILIVNALIVNFLGCTWITERVYVIRMGSAPPDRSRYLLSSSEVSSSVTQYNAPSSYN